MGLCATIQVIRAIVVESRPNLMTEPQVTI